MKTLIRSVIVTLAAGAALALPTVASARPASTTFTVTGNEYAFTQTVGSFAGRASGNAGDSGLWNARVEHDPLGSQPTYINGGTFEMTTVRGFSADYVTGDFVHHGGQITVLDPGAGCTNQRYLVAGRLENVATSTTSSGTGMFSAVLTHYRYSLFGRCIIYNARVVGSVSFLY
jgi:energy-converting hydrogenase Eha subunit A